jgi:hypothetical protein
MDNRLKLEIGAGIVVLILGLLALKQWNDKQVEVRVAEVVAQHDRETDAKLDAKLKQLDQADSARQRTYDQQNSALQKSTPQQIVVKLPEYVPQATAPVQVLPATSPIVQSGQAHAGDALVPAADIKPIAQALLDGNKCAGDLASCKVTQQTWEEKYAAKNDEAQRWQTAAKGGSIWKRLGKDVLKLAIGVGVGYALHK